MEGDKYNSVLNTATFLASKGEVRLALSLIKITLEKFFIEKEGLKESGIENEEKLNEIEVLLTQKYIAFRSKLEGEKLPYWRTMVNSLIIGIVAAVSIVGTFIGIFYITKSTIIDKLTNTLTSEIHDMSAAVKFEIPGIAEKIRAEIPSISHKLSEKIKKDEAGEDK